MANDLMTQGAVPMNIDAILDASALLADYKDMYGSDAQPSFPFCKMPSQGMTAWQIKGDEDDEDPEIVKAIEGVVLMSQRTNAYWAQSIDQGGGKMPDCHSADGVCGFDTENNRHDCATCPRNQFGSDGRGKACKNSVRLYVLRDGMPMPTVVHLSATGIKAFQKYGESLMIPKKRGQRPMKMTAVMTRIGLKVEVNADGIKYSKPTFECAGPLDPDTAELMRGYAEQLKQAAQAAQFAPVEETPF